MSIAVLLVFVVNYKFHKQYKHITAAPIEKEPFSFKLFRPLLVLGLVSFIIMGSEGAIVDWSGLYLQEISKAPEFLLGAGFLAFSCAMTVGRFMGDAISARIGSVRIVILGTCIAILGYTAVLSTYTLMAITGFALIGLGFSVIIPELFRIGGNVKGVESSQGVAFIAGTGYSGFLMAPPVLGFLAESATLKASFISLLATACLVLLAGFYLLSRKR
jgi:fucose permease